jgi:hypothetical protein
MTTIHNSTRNKNRGIAFLGIALLALFISPRAQADASLGVGVSTLGANLQLTTAVSNNVDLRGIGSYLPYTYNNGYSGVNFEAKLTLESGLLVADFYPWQHGFHLSAGGMVDRNEVSLTGQTASGVFSLNGHDYSSTQITSLTGKVKLNPVSPYIGIDFSRSVHTNSNWSVPFDPGALYQGRPSLTYCVISPGNPGAEFYSAGAYEERKMRHDLDHLAWHPVQGAAVAYRF